MSRQKYPDIPKHADYNMVINMMYDGFWVTDPEGRLLEVNDAYSRMSGYSREELFSMCVSDFETMEKPEETALHIRQIIQNGGDRFTTCHRCRDGKILHLEINVKVSEDKEKRLLVLLHDITEHQAMEKALRKVRDEQERQVELRTAAAIESAEESRDLYNNAPCGFHSLDENGVFVQINETELKWLGYTREEILGKKKFSDLITSKSLEVFVDNFSVFKERGWVADLEFEMICRDGSILPVILSATSIRDADGKFRMSRSTVYDITERKQAEEKISRLNRIYSLLSSINEAIVRLRDPEELFRQVCRIAVEDGGFLMVWVGLIDQVTREVKPVAFYGVEEDYLKNIRISFDDISIGNGPTGTAVREGRYDICDDFEMDPRMKPWRDEALSRGFRSSIALPLKAGGETAGALTLYAQEKNFFNEEEILLLQQLTDDISFAMEFMIREEQRMFAEIELKKYRDHLEELVKERTEQLVMSNEQLQREITERMKSEERIQEIARKLAQSNKELELFAYVASHDLKEPLRKITMFGERLRNQCARSLDERGLDYLMRMENASERMKLLIDGVLQLSRITTGAVDMKKVELSKVLEEVKSDLEISIIDTNATIEAYDLPVVEADSLQMRQLFMNLISNSLKYCEKFPCVIIRSRRLSRHFHELSFADNGIGFDEKYIESIFKPFQRLHGRGKYEGIGMGLAICQRIVSRHNGSITVKSIPHQGSTFIISLPALL